jgi:hypothetical protein
MEQLNRECRELEARLADPVVYDGDPARLEDLQVRYGAARRALSDAETRWLRAQDALDRS